MVTICHASISENKTVNGKRGDQTGKEVCIRTWYNKPWDMVIRFKDPDMREKCAAAMEYAAQNDHIGYSQNDRNSLLAVVRPYGYDPRTVKTDVNTDCSALVTVACIYAGIAESAMVKGGNSATTRTLKSRLMATGEVDIFTSKDYTQKTDKLLRGDILLATGKHVVVVNSGKVIAHTEDELDKVARDVIAGKYGSGAARRTALQAAGYNAAIVQARVNEILKETKK